MLHQVAVRQLMVHWCSWVTSTIGQLGLLCIELPDSDTFAFFIYSFPTATACMAQVGKGNDAVESVGEAQQLSKGPTSVHLLSSTACAYPHLRGATHM